MKHVSKKLPQLYQFNKDECKDVYVYIDFSNPICCWNFIRGVLDSSSNLSNYFGFHVCSFFLKSRLINQKYFLLEQQLEFIRSTEFKEKISRLSGLYFFDSLQSAKSAENLIPSFSKENLVKCLLPNNVSYQKHDMNWITYHAGDSNISWMKQYWNGDTCCQSPYGIPIYECLTDGYLIVNEQELRDKLYRECAKNNLNDLFFLQLGICGSHYGYPLSEVFYSTNMNSDCIEINPTICFDEDTAIHIFENVEKNDLNYALSIKKVAFTGELHTPDFSRYIYKIPLVQP